MTPPPQPSTQTFPHHHQGPRATPGLLYWVGQVLNIDGLDLPGDLGGIEGNALGTFSEIMPPETCFIIFMCFK